MGNQLVPSGDNNRKIVSVKVGNRQVDQKVASFIPAQIDQIESAESHQIARVLLDTHAKVMQLVNGQSQKISDKMLEWRETQPFAMDAVGELVTQTQKDRHEQLGRYLDTSMKAYENMEDPAVDAVSFKKDLLQGLATVRMKQVTKQEEKQGKIKLDIPGFEDPDLDVTEAVTVSEEVKDNSDEEAEELAVRDMLSQLSDRDINRILIDAYGYDNEEDRKVYVGKVLANKNFEHDEKHVQSAVERITARLMQLEKSKVDPYRLNGSKIVAIGAQPEVVRVDPSKGAVQAQLREWTKNRPNTKKSLTLDDGTVVVPEGPLRVDYFEGTLVVYLNNGKILELAGTIANNGSPETDLEKKVSELYAAEKEVDRPAGIYAHDAGEVSRMIRFLGKDGERVVFEMTDTKKHVEVSRDQTGKLHIEGLEGAIPAKYRAMRTADFREQFLSNPLKFASAKNMEVEFGENA